MPRLVAIRSYPRGPHLFVLNQRAHHGATGCLVTLAGIVARRPAVIAAGVLLCAHDWRDARIWFAREAAGPFT